MKAALLTEPQAPIAIAEVAPPQAGLHEVVIKVEVCGLCHTDLHIVDGEWKLTLLPLIPGHEVVGKVVEIGTGVTDLAQGERVGVSWVHQACQNCEHCLTGYETQCEKQLNTGYTINGGFAELIKVPANFVSKIPATLPSATAATLLCAGVTAYRALKESNLHIGQTIAIFGIGGLGHFAVQIAKAMGLYVVAVDINAEKLALAASYGADLLINGATESPAKVLRKLGGAHAAINFVANGKTMEEAFYGLRRCGTLVVVGLPRTEFTLPIIPLVGRGIRIVGSVVGTREDIRQLLALAAIGKVTAVTEERPLSDINNVFAAMREGSINGRVVLRIAEENG
jgi:propanol-preferring alcohol dehydrogenase